MVLSITRILHSDIDKTLTSDGKGPKLIFDYAISLVTLLLIIICIAKKSSGNDTSASNEENASEDATYNQNADNGNTDRRREEKQRKIHILKIIESGNMQQNITCDHLQSKSCRSIDKTVSSEVSEDSSEFNCNASDDDGTFSSDEEAGYGTILISPYLDDRKRSSSSTLDGSNSEKSIKTFSNSCVICLEEYREGDTITWSSNNNCCHAFHRDCLINYLVKVKEEDTYPCPCCRQNFFLHNESDNR